MHLILSTYEADRYMPNVFAICLHEGKRPLRSTAGQLDWRLEGAISRMILSDQFKGERGEHVLHFSMARGSKVFIFGAGPRGTDTPEEVSKRAELMMDILHKAGQKEFVLAAEAMMLSSDSADELKMSSLKFLEGLLRANARLKIDPHITVPCPGGDMEIVRDQIKSALDTLGRTSDVTLVEPSEE